MAASHWSWHFRRRKLPPAAAAATSAPNLPRQAAGTVAGLDVLRHVPRSADGGADVRLCREALQRRAARLRQFGPDLAHDGVWNMLLELVVARGEGRSIPIKCVWLASGLSQSTSLRWVNHLAAAGHVHRSTDPADARRQFIEIDDGLAEQVIEFLRLTEG